MRKTLIATCALACLLPAAALAGGVGTTGPAMADWSGAYTGIGFGYNFGHVKVTDLDSYNGPPPIKYDPKGIQASAFLGYNWVFWSDFVVGTEGEIGWFDISGNKQYPPYVGVRGPDDSVASVSGGFGTTLTGHVGYTFNRWELFAKGGFAGADLRTRFIDTNPVGTTLVAGTSQRDFMAGYTVGGGVAYMFADSHISAGLEYAYYDFGDVTQRAVSAGGTTYRFRHAVTTNAVKLSLTYHFGGPVF